MKTWRIEEIHVSPMGEARWLVVSGGYQTRDEAEIAMTRLNQRGGNERRIVELARNEQQ